MHAPVRFPIEVEEFLTWLRVEKGRAPTTLAAYRRDLAGWLRWLAAHHVELAAATEDDITSHVDELRTAGRSPATLKRLVVAIRSLHRFLAVEGLVDHDPGSDVEVPRVPQGLPKALTEGEVNALLDAVLGDDAVACRDRAVLEVLYGTGLRIGELVGLSIGDLDLEEGQLRAFGKGSKERIVPLGRPAAAALRAWLDPDRRGTLAPERWKQRSDAEAVFLNVRGGRLTRQGAWGIVRKYGAMVGLSGRLTPHVLRHSCATHMLDHGAEIRYVQELLGHASVSTTQIYTKVSTERLWQVYRAAHPRARYE